MSITEKLGEAEKQKELLLPKFSKVGSKYKNKYFLDASFFRVCFCILYRGFYCRRRGQWILSRQHLNAGVFFSPYEYSKCSGVLKHFLLFLHAPMMLLLLLWVSITTIRKWDSLDLFEQNAKPQFVRSAILFTCCGFVRFGSKETTPAQKWVMMLQLIACGYAWLTSLFFLLSPPLMNSFFFCGVLLSCEQM